MWLLFLGFKNCPNIVNENIHWFAKQLKLSKLQRHFLVFPNIEQKIMH